jgi:hypothetical protein
MDDTPATRQATKARIGPWYVLQNRSPSAPGMKFSTLLWLVNKGHVSARSIVRGPTTYQLWRYAAHIRGLSREWGLCYSCGGSIERTATICPNCERPQEPPANPDALLDARPTATAPMQIAQGLEVAAAGAPVELSHAERMRQRQEMIRREQPDAHRTAAAAVVSGTELAVALRDADHADATSRRGNVMNVALFFIVLIVGATAALLYLRPEYRAPAKQWAQDKWQSVRDAIASVQPQEKPQPSAPTQTATPADVMAAGDPAPEPSADDAEKIAAQAQLARNTEPAPAPVPESRPQPPPVQVAEVKPVQQAPVEAKPQEQPMTLDQAIAEARALWVQAIDAEARSDFDQAVKCYERIKQLPSSAWPGGLQISLDLARKRASQTSSR